MTNTAFGPVGAFGFDFDCPPSAAAPPEDRTGDLLISRRRVGVALFAWSLVVGAAEITRAAQGRTPTADSDMITVDATSFQSDME
jgi:hypothetical protein